MLGYAQKLFLAKHPSHRWSMPAPSGMDSWRILLQLKESGLTALRYIDLLLAAKLLRPFEPQQEAMAAFICHLSLAAKNGHLCVKVIGDEIIPSLEETWLDDPASSAELVSSLAAIKKEILLALKSGAPPFIFSCDEMDKKATKGAKFLLPIYRQEERYYLQRHWRLETEVLTDLLPILQEQTLYPAIDHKAAGELIDSCLGQGALQQAQAEAIRKSAVSSFVVITGGPGTGKTHTAGMLLRILWKSMLPQERSSCRIALAAPTGKAAAQLQASIHRSLKDQGDFPDISATTLHSLLGLGKRKGKGAPASLDCDILLVDESSMIDASLMQRLLSSIKKGSRLVMLGDQNQLPPVEIGAFFSDLVDALQEHPLAKDTICSLTTCLRTELATIVDFAKQIQHGDAKKVIRTLKLSMESAVEGLSFIPLADSDHFKKVKDQLLKKVLAHFPSSLSQLPDDLQELLRQFGTFRLLTPLREGPWGTRSLNALFLQNALAKAQKKDYFIAPIMISGNHLKLELFNGEIGLLITPPHVGNDAKESFAFFPSPQSSQGRKIPALLLPKYEYAYCLSIHKSQGSEFDHVLLLLPKGTETFGREALYTGVTRAKKQVEVWSQESTIEGMLHHSATRHSGIKSRIGRIEVS